MKRSPEAPRQECPLSPRETEVARYLGGEMSPSQIADSLGISKETVRIHIRNIYGKLSVRSRHAAVLTLVRKGIFPLDAN